MARDDQPQKTMLVCTGLNRPKLNQLTWSTSGATNLIPKYSPTEVPNTNQKVADPRYQSISLVNFGSISGRLTAFFLVAINRGVFTSATLCNNPFLSSGAFSPDSSVLLSLKSSACLRLISSSLTSPVLKSCKDFARYLASLLILLSRTVFTRLFTFRATRYTAITNIIRIREIVIITPGLVHALSLAAGVCANS